MNTLRFIDRRVGYFIAAGLILLAMFLPALASAAQITSRSIALSSSSAAATGVTYAFEFTNVADSVSAVIDFCTESPLVGEACTGPAGLDANTSVGITGAGFTLDSAGTAPDANTVVIDGTFEDTVNFELTGITNPTNDQTFYARIVTYETANAAAANTYSSETPGTYADDGGVALATTDTIGVSGAVLEALSFCVGKTAITEDCNLAGNSAPNLALGEEVSPGVIALEAGTLSTDSLFAQISTNALSGAVISLKSSATDCGGLMRAGSVNCDIKPTNPAMDETAIEAAADGRFGVLVAEAADPAADSDGTIAPGLGYSAADNYFMDFVDGNGSGVTSTYGSQIANTSGGPVTNKNIEFTFGASAQNSTPAGMYAADMSLIATGTF